MRKRRASLSVTDLAKKKLASSGLTLEDAKQLNIHIQTAIQTQKNHRAFKPLASLRFDYFKPDGSPARDIPVGEPFYRLRYLEGGTGFAALAKGQPRYVQPPHTAPVAYYPQNFEDWPTLIHDVDEPLIITEGELKAAKACKEGFPTLGLGGVYNWRSAKMGIMWLESLKWINWLRRNVYICFDSDYQTNPAVAMALQSFAEALEDQGSFVHLVTLPDVPEVSGKIGLDDFLTFGGPTANKVFQTLLVEAEPLGLARPLWQLNQQYVYVRRPGFILDQKDFENRVTPASFRDYLEAPRRYLERRVNADGQVQYKTTSAAATWLKWPLRNEVKCVTYAPGKKKFINGEFNIWPGWKVAPKKGCVKRFHQLIDFLFQHAEAGAKEWFLQWCAYPLQHPGTKLFSCVVVHGVVHGTGKSLVGYTLGEIYGNNFTEVRESLMTSRFNEQLEAKQFILGDDIKTTRRDADNVKTMLTQQILWVERKGIPKFPVPDRINYYFTSNHPDVFFLEDTDRRFFIHEVIGSPLPFTFYEDYWTWLTKGGGAAAVFDYLLSVDISGFNPAAPPFGTHAKARMLAAGQSDLASWVRQLLHAPEDVLRVGEVAIEKDLLTNKELLLLYDPEGRTRVTANGLGRELSRAGVRQVYDGRPLRGPDGQQARYYAIRNAEKWFSLSDQQIRAAVRNGEKKPPRRPRRPRVRRRVEKV